MRTKPGRYRRPPACKQKNTITCMLSGYTPDGEGLYPENPFHAPLNP